MSPTADRRQFLRTAGLLGLSAGPLAAGPGPKPPPASRGGLALPVEPDPPLPAGAVARLGSRRMRVGKHVHGLKFSPTGKLLVVADREAIWFWETATGRVAFRFKYPDEGISDGAVTADTLALLVRRNGVNREEFELRHYALGTGALKSSVPISPEPTQGASDGMDVGPDAALVAQAAGGKVRVFDGATGKPLWSDQAAADAHAFSPDGRRLIAGVGSTLRVYDARTGKVLAALAPWKAAGGTVTPPVASADGKWLAAQADRGRETVSVWDVPAGKLLHTIKSHGKPLAFTPDGRQLLTATPDGAAAWDVATGKKLRDLDLGSPGEVVVSPDGTMLAARSSDAVWLYDAKTGDLLPQSADPPGNPEPLWFTPDGRLVGQLTAWGGWAVWDVKANKSRLVRMPRTGSLTPLGLSADGTVGLYREDKSGDFQVRDVATGRVVRTLKLPDETKGEPWAATPDGRTVFATADGTGTVLDATTGRSRLIKVGRHAQPAVGSTIRFQMFALDPDGRSAAVTADAPGEDGVPAHRVALYDLTGARPPEHFPLDGQASRIVIAPGGRRVAVALEPIFANGSREVPRGGVSIFDAGSPHPVSHIAPEREEQTAVLAFSPDGRTLARPTPGEKGVTLWESATGRLRTRFALDGEVHALAFSPDGRTLAASCANGPVVLWDVLGDRTAPAAAPDRAALDRAWAALADPDAEAAFRAVRLLARFPDRSLPYLTDRLPRASALDRARVKKLIADLNDDSFQVREAAQRELTARIDEVSADLRAALDAAPPAEAAQRLEQLLRRADHLTPDRLRWLRTAEAVEWAGTPEAVKLLKRWTAGGYSSRLAAEAKQGLDRIAR